jgi:hypothetical protein
MFRIPNTLKNVNHVLCCYCSRFNPKPKPRPTCYFKANFTIQIAPHAKVGGGQIGGGRGGHNPEDVRRMVRVENPLYVAAK